MRNIAKGLLLALVCAAAWTFWSILSDMVVALNSRTAILYLVMIEALVLLMSLAIMAAYGGVTRKGLSIRDRRLAKYPIVAGICFGIGTIIYYSLIGNQNYPLVSSFQFGYVIVLALLINRIKHERLTRRYLLGSVIVVMGFALQTLALGQVNSSAALTVILPSVALLVLYAVGFYASFYYAYGKMQLAYAVPMVLASLFVPVLIYGFAVSAFSGLALISGTGIVLSVAIAAFIIIAYYAEEFSYRLLRNARAKYLNLANILTNLELVGIAIFSILFLKLSYPMLVAGLILTTLGIVLVAVS